MGVSVQSQSSGPISGRSDPTRTVLVSGSSPSLWLPQAPGAAFPGDSSPGAWTTYAWWNNVGPQPSTQPTQTAGMFLATVGVNGILSPGAGTLAWNGNTFAWADLVEEELVFLFVCGANQGLGVGWNVNMALFVPRGTGGDEAALVNIVGSYDAVGNPIGSPSGVDSLAFGPGTQFCAIANQGPFTVSNEFWAPQGLGEDATGISYGVVNVPNSGGNIWGGIHSGSNEPIELLSKTMNDGSPVPAGLPIQPATGGAPLSFPFYVIFTMVSTSDLAGIATRIGEVPGQPDIPGPSLGVRDRLADKVRPHHVKQDLEGGGGIWIETHD